MYEAGYIIIRQTYTWFNVELDLVVFLVLGTNAVGS